MNRLTKQQQQYILDFYFRCGSQEEIESGRDLIASSPEAARLYADLESSLNDLDHMKYDACPDNLVDLTVARLKLAASGTKTQNSKLHKLLEKERHSNDRTPINPPSLSPQLPPISDRSFLRPVFEVLAAAACIFLVAGILFPGLSLVRDHSQKVACARNLGRIGTAFSQARHDNLTLAGVHAGSPWWKIGSQGEKTESNTRPPYTLVKENYVTADAFICKGYKDARPLDCASSQLSKYKDFPDRHNISFSFSLSCNENANPPRSGRRIIASDLNPVFVPVFKKLPCDPSFYEKMTEFEKLPLDQNLKNLLSQNHGGKGQNVLYCDGGVEYIRERIVNGDDIFTVNGIDAYTGCEVPADQNDTFLAP